jgi:hypothetical protein
MIQCGFGRNSMFPSNPRSQTKDESEHIPVFTITQNASGLSPRQRFGNPRRGSPRSGLTPRSLLKQDPARSSFERALGSTLRLFFGRVKTESVFKRRKEAECQGFPARTDAPSAATARWAVANVRETRFPAKRWILENYRLKGDGLDESKNRK